MIENTVNTKDMAEHLERVKDAVAWTLGAVGEFISDRVLSPIGTGASRLAPVAGEAKSCANRKVKAGKDAALNAGGAASQVAMTAGSAVKDLAVRAGETARDVIGEGLTAGHRMVRKVPGVVRAEDRVSDAVKGLPDRLDLVRADDVAALKRSIDSLTRQVDQLVDNSSS